MQIYDYHSAHLYAEVSQNKESRINPMKSKYVPDLTRQMALCEANYARLSKLLPDIDGCQQRDFIVDVAERQSKVSISVQERFKFTSTLLIVQQFLTADDSADIHRWLSPQLVVRLYHDARMAEVISPTRGSQLLGKYRYPNKSMYQVDEKIQLNDYLAQWLSHCLTQGYQSHEILNKCLSAYE